MEQELYILIQNCELYSESEQYLQSVKDVLNSKKEYTQEDIEFIHNKLPNITYYSGCFILSTIHLAVKKGLYQTVKLMLENGCPINQSNSEDRFPIHLVAETGDNKMLNLLLDNGSSVYINNQDIYGFTPLYFAVLNNKNDTVKTLLNAGADPDTYETLSDYPLSQAIKNKNFDIIKLLLRYSTHINHWYIIQTLIPYYLEYLPYLIRHGLNLNKNSILHYYSINKEIEPIKLLLRFGANPNVKNRFGNKPVINVMQSNFDSEDTNIIISLLSSWFSSLHTVCFRYILIHNISVKGVPKSVLQFTQ